MNATPFQMTLSTTTLRLLTLVGWLAWSMTAVAQDDASKPAEEKEKENTFTVDLDFLTRGELRYGGLTDNKQKIDKPSSFLLERTRVALGYERKYIQANVTIQHAGIGVGIKMLAGHLHRGFAGDDPGYYGRLRYAQDVSAVTAACMMIPRRVYEAVGGLDESFSLVFNDVDLCLRIREAGYLIVWTPWAELIHYESKSRGPDEDTPAKKRFFIRETNRFLRRWHRVLEAGDPYYNPNLTRWKEDFSPRG